MSASDIPTAGYSSSLHMARVLVQTMHCPEAIRTRILEDFNHAPAHRTIEKLRAEHLASLHQRADNDYDPADAWTPCKDSDRAEQVSRDFLWRLDQERLLSQRRKEAA